MDRNIKVKSESLPSRCEICHQVDFFDPQTNICQRCSPITSFSVTKTLSNRNELKVRSAVGLAIGFFTAVVLGEAFSQVVSPIHAWSTIWMLPGAIVGLCVGAVTGNKKLLITKSLFGVFLSAILWFFTMCIVFLFSQDYYGDFPLYRDSLSGTYFKHHVEAFDISSWIFFAVAHGWVVGFLTTLVTEVIRKSEYKSEVQIANKPSFEQFMATDFKTLIGFVLSVALLLTNVVLVIGGTLVGIMTVFPTPGLSLSLLLLGSVGGTLAGAIASFIVWLVIAAFGRLFPKEVEQLLSPLIELIGGKNEAVKQTIRKYMVS